MNKAVITEIHNLKFLMIYEEDVLYECHPLMYSDAPQIGSIYIGRVEKVVKNIQSAFVRLTPDYVGYLPLDQKPALVLNRTLPKGLSSIAENDLVLVQVEQEAQKLKQARVTGNISFTGNYVALDLQKDILGVSKKIKEQSRVTELKNLLEPEYGCIYRTMCKEASNDRIIEEYQMLKERMDTLIHKATYERKTGCIWSGKPEYQRILDEYGMERINEIRTDISEIYEELVVSGYTNVSLYQEEGYSLCKLYGLETELSHIRSKKVWLKSGGFLVIEPTEAMVVIDVNSGKSIGKKDKDKHILKINIEAATEVVRQLRLRNLSGIIMIDFINMDLSESKKLVVDLLKKELNKDKIPGYFVEITNLDIFELTRKKSRRPLHEVLNEFFEKNN